MNFYNHISQRKDIEVKVNFEHVKNISNRDFFIKNVDDIVNLDSFKHEHPKWMGTYASKHKLNVKDCYNNYWVHYLNKTAWLCSMEVTYLNKKYNYYSLSTRKHDSLNLLMMDKQDSIKNIIKI